MRTPTIALFNNKGGVGKTSLVYHLAWVYADLGLRVVAVDLDPQANLTAAFLEDDDLEALWTAGPPARSIYGSLLPIIKGTGDVGPPALETIEDNLSLLVGDLALSSFEDRLSAAWPRCLDRDESAFRVVSAFWRTVHAASERHRADVALIDLGPNLGAINRSALLAADFVVVPLSPDLFSLQGLRNLGPTLREWRAEWTDRLQRNPARDLTLPAGTMEPVGYVVMQHSVRLDRPVATYDRWIARIPEVYAATVLDHHGPAPTSIQDDENCIALLKHYRSLMPLAQEARKPIFHLKPADGALGAHQQAVRDAATHFEHLARRIGERTGVAVPAPLLPV